MARFPADALFVLFTAALWAQQPASSSSKPPTYTKSSVPEPGAISDGIYHNSSFGFTYKLPYGWVDRTRQMQDDGPNTPNGNAAKPLLLLAIFERPPEATGEGVNSAVVIAAEPLSNYPGLKTAAEYFGPLTEVAASKGLQPEGAPQLFSIGSTQLVRGDFSKSRGAATVYQSSLVLLEKGYDLSFTFIGDSEDGVNELIERLSFAARKAAH